MLRNRHRHSTRYMRVLVTRSAVALVALTAASPATADPGADTPVAPSYGSPYVERAEWVQWDGLPSLRVYPTPAGRGAAGRIGSGAQAAQAWAEVLMAAPDADSAGMRAQFFCHWQFAELADPGKLSWNLEPWRPIVDETELVDSGCNPGGADVGVPAPRGGGV